MNTTCQTSPSPRYRALKRIFIALIGGTVLLLGVAMMVLPGPGILAIFAGLAILASEFLWARRALHKCKGAVEKVRRNGGWWKFWRRWLNKRSTSGDKPPAPGAPETQKPASGKSQLRHEVRAKEKQMA